MPSTSIATSPERASQPGSTSGNGHAPSSAVVDAAPGIAPGIAIAPPEPSTDVPRINDPPVISLRWRAIYGSAWTTAEYVASQVLRLASLLILTRLFIPHERGLGEMISMFMLALHMFSDVGIGPAIIHSKRGDKMEYLNTAWTIQAGRGVLLWVAATIGAWPVAMFFGEPRLVALIMVAGFGSVIQGVASTSVVYLNRQLQMRALTILSLATYVVHIAATIAYALYSPTAWAIVFGGLAAEIFHTVASHLILPGHRNWFHWNWDDAKSMLRFGRWIFLSTVLTFLAMQADYIVLGKLLGAAMLGIYGIALQISVMPTRFIKKIGMQIMFPVLSEVARDRPEQLRHTLLRTRLVLIGIGLVVLVPLVLFGDVAIRLMLTPQWHAAGWMLQILAAGSIVGLINSTYGAPLLALGQSFWAMVLLAIQIVILLAAVLIGYHFYGVVGFVAGFALVELLNYPATAAVLRRHKLWQPEIDFPVILIAVATAAVGYFVL